MGSAITLEILNARKEELQNAIEVTIKQIKEIESALLTSQQSLTAQQGALRQVELFIQQAQSNEPTKKKRALDPKQSVDTSEKE
jgi:hypothetical protein